MIGRRVSHFYIVRALGSGGMGVVYEAQDTRLPRSVAIKFLKPSMWRDAEAVRRFKREARLASSLNHPNICTVLDVDEGEGEGESFIVMELLRGRSLKARLAAGPVSLDELLDVAVQAADALAAAHGRNIVHRDIAPGNIFLTDTGLVKLLDFGVAKLFADAFDGDASTDELTTSGLVAGTVAYMAPERLVEDAPVDHRCDLYSLGAVLYQMATGARPFDVAPLTALMRAIEHDAPVPVRDLAPHHPEALAQLIERLLAKRPEDRHESARALRVDLDRLRRASPVARPSNGETPADPSVAVLPFEIIGPTDAATAHFRDGLAEELRRRLDTLGARVAPATSTRALAGRAAREIGETLGVGLVLEGAVQGTAERVRVTATLVDAARERSVLPTLKIERRAADLLGLQDDVARAIAAGVAPALGRGALRRFSREPSAYHAFRRGQHYWQSCLTGGWRPAIEHFQYAVQRDDGFALAHAALATAYNFLGLYCLMKPKLAFGVAARAAQRAIEIDDALAEAHVEAAMAKFGGEWDWDGAESAFRRAIALDPTNPLAHAYYAWLLMLLHRDDAALVEAERGSALAPSSRLVTTARAQTLYIGGRPEEALALCSACLRADPAYVFAVHLRGLCHLVTSDRERAVADLERAATLSRRTPYHLGLLGRCYGQFGMRDEALGLVAELDAQSRDAYVPPQSYVFIHAGLGERDRALAHQEQAYEDGASPLNYLAPAIRDLYALDPYHSQRLKQMRLTL